MHLVVILLSASVVLVAGWAALGWGQRLRGWSDRRDLQLLALIAPMASLAIAIGGAHHFAGQVCFLGAAPIDYVLSLAVPSLMGVLAAVAIGLGILRLIVMRVTWGARGRPAPSELQDRVVQLAARMGLAAPRMRMCDERRPVALTFGLLRPTLLVSRWMLDELDPEELDAVLAHELAHIARRDYLVDWLATVLRDAFTYLPTSWAAHRQLQEDKELACDDLAVRATSRPLALASALATVQLHGTGARMAGAQALADRGQLAEARIRRLLDSPSRSGAQGSRWLTPVGSGALALAGIAAIEVMNVASLLGPLGCTHGLALTTLL